MGRLDTGGADGDSHAEPRNRGEAHHSARLTIAAVWDIRSSVPHGASIKGLARQYGVAPKTVRDVVQGITWKWLYTAEINPYGER